MSKQKEAGSEIYEILAFTFIGQKTAGEALKEIKSSGELAGYEILAEAVVEQDKKGKTHIHEPGSGGVGAAVGGITGGLLALIGGPAGLLVWALGGAALGGIAGHYLGRSIPKKDLEELGENLTPDSSALLMLLEDTYSEGVINSMAGYTANVVTMTVSDELSGEIAQYRAGELTDPEGDVIAGERVVGIDAAGEVVSDGYLAVAVPEDAAAVDDETGDEADDGEATDKQS
ncbi:MAG: DUF1269 domain-containing protein [Chloroflexota bacterium]|nr:DUF1269 domain-containing protein [Chloroflexota bacterium]